MKLFKVGLILQISYCVLCLIAVVCLPLYTLFYPSVFGNICFRIGATLTFISTFNPIGLAGTIMNVCAYFVSDYPKSKKALAWSIAAPILIILSWLAAVCSFVYHSGGV